MITFIDKNQSKIGSIFILCVLFSSAVIIDAYTLTHINLTLPEPELLVPIRVDEKLNEIFEPQVCTSAECIRSAKEILSAMNTSVDPCDDFYQFTCGQWRTEHPIQKGYNETSMIIVAKQNLIKDVLKLVKSNEAVDEPTPLRKSRDFFRSCMDQESRENLRYDSVFKHLSQLGLPAIPRFFNMSNTVEDTDFKFDWMKTDIAFHAMFQTQLLVNCEVGTNMFNSSQIIHICHMPKHKFRFPNVKLPPDEEDSLFDVDIYSEEQTAIQKAWQKLTNFSITTLIKEKYDLPADFQERFDAALELINKTESYISEMKHLANQNYAAVDVDMLEELQMSTDEYVNKNDRPSKLNWEQYLEESFKYSNLTGDLHDDTLVLINMKEHHYYKQINDFLAKTSEVQLELWVWWRAVLNLMIHTTSDATQYVDEIFHAADVNNELPREMDCSRLTSSFMDLAIVHSLADQYFQNVSKPKVKELWNKISDAFEIRVNALTWMDEKTKSLTIEKSKAMMDFIAYPEWLQDKNILESFYSSVNINADTYLDNVIEFNKFTRKRNLEQFFLTNNKEWPRELNAMEINAYYSVPNNVMAVPFAIIKYLFYDRGLDASNFGSLGSILGHELTHGFDDGGRHFDKTGTFSEWWSDETSEEFSNLSECFIKQYDQFYVPESDSYINGSLTLGENLADNGGLHHAYLAYQNHKKKNDEELRLPGLEQFTNDQLFFISYAGFWCSDRRTDGPKLEMEDVHCPDKFRVLGNLMNAEEFANAFNCPLGSNMNPKKSKCKIW